MNRVGACVVCSVFVAASCQTYDFERVVPLAFSQTTHREVIASGRLKPNVMMLVDNSGSMREPISKTPACAVGVLLDGGTKYCGDSATNLCPDTCATRTSELKKSLGAFLQNSGGIARFGAAQFPASATDQCLPTSGIDVPFPAPSPVDDEAALATLNTKAREIATFIERRTPNGGTPTAASLLFVGNYSGLNDETDGRDDLVLLLTDGLPNCSPGNLTRIDQEATVEQIKNLKRKGIRTIVVGFGTGSSEAAVLNAMAREGGFARQCPNGTDAECGANDSCNRSNNLCNSAFFSATNGAELSETLTAISKGLEGSCKFTLNDKPSDPRYLAVLVDSVTVKDSDFSYDFGANQVTFLGKTCERITSSTARNPVTVEFRIVQEL